MARRPFIEDHCVLLKSNTVSRTDFEAGTGWQLKPEGACKGDICIPLRQIDASADSLDARQLANAIGLPVAANAEHGLLALGPEAIDGKALATAEAPSLQLPDLNGQMFDLASLRGRKVLLYAWAPY